MRHFHRTPLLLTLALILAAPPGRAALPKAYPPDNSAVPTVEVWRVRILNAPGGPVEASGDAGRTWALIGRVSTPASAALTGYLASGYAPVGSVAATAVHGIRIRLGALSDGYPALINILPSQFATTPAGFGGQVAGASGIYTDIPAGYGLFRDLAPYVGSPVFLAGSGGTLQPLTSAYTPHPGDTLVIESRRVARALRSVTFVNHGGGPVIATYADGTSEVVTHVAQPVTGVGRFDGTSYTGVGAINTNHTCVITVSTAPVSPPDSMEGVGAERRGGFQIEPAYHNTQTQEAGAAQVLVVGTPKATRPELEGRPPLFFGTLSLAWDPGDPAHSWVCEVRTRATGGRWLPMPAMVGSDAGAIAARGITAFRLRRDLGDDDPAYVQGVIERAGRRYQEGRARLAASGAIPLVRGLYTAYNGMTAARRPALVTYDVDGQFSTMTGAAPYTMVWDSRAVPDGEHVIEAVSEDAAGRVIADTIKSVYVDNARAVR